MRHGGKKYILIFVISLIYVLLELSFAKWNHHRMGSNKKKIVNLFIRIHWKSTIIFDCISNEPNKQRHRFYQPNWKKQKFWNYENEIHHFINMNHNDLWFIQIFFVFVILFEFIGKIPSYDFRSEHLHCSHIALNLAWLPQFFLLSSFKSLLNYSWLGDYWSLFSFILFEFFSLRAFVIFLASYFFPFDRITLESKAVFCRSTNILKSRQCRLVWCGWLEMKTTYRRTAMSNA